MPRFSIGNSSSEDDEEGLSFVQRRPKKHRLVIPSRRVPAIAEHINNSSTDNNNNTIIAEEDDNLDGVDSRFIEDEEVEDQRENDEGDGLIGEEDEEQDEELFVEEEEEESWIEDEWCRGLKFKKRKERDREGPSEDNAPISVTLTDPDVLDCPICLESLAAPVFQCENGHTACSSCCSKLRNKCPSCSLPIGYNRCRAIEKVLESIKISCRNMKYGCKETVSYSKKHEHEQTCIHEPCECPQPGCDFVGSSKQLYQHFNYLHPGMGIYDAMKLCKADVSTICLGLAASMGAFLLASGTKGKRYCMPNARVMIHQPLGTSGGKASEMSIRIREMAYHKVKLNKILSRVTGKPESQVEMDTDRDNFMNPWEAMEYGLVDAVIDDGKPGLVAPIGDAAPPPKTRVWDMWKIEGTKKAKKNLPSEERISQGGDERGTNKEEEAPAPV